MMIGLRMRDLPASMHAIARRAFAFTCVEHDAIAFTSQTIKLCMLADGGSSSRIRPLDWSATTTNGSSLPPHTFCAIRSATDGTLTIRRRHKRI
jgi:hypothetical protein